MSGEKAAGAGDRGGIYPVAAISARALA